MICSLPFLEIDEGGLETLFSAYQQLIPAMKAYLVNAESGRINLEALIQLFGLLAKREKEVFAKLIDERKEVAAKEEVKIDQIVEEKLKEPIPEPSDTAMVENLIMQLKYQKDVAAKKSKTHF